MPFHIGYFILQGRCRGQVAGQPVQLDPGSFLWLPPGTRHELEQDPASPRLRHLHLTFSVRRDDREWTLRDPLLIKNAPDVRLPFQSLVEEIQLGEAGRNPSTYRSHRLLALALLLFTAVFEQSTRAGDPIRRFTHSQCRQLQERAVDATAQRLTPAQLGRELGWSPRYFTRLFRNTFGCPPRVWLMRQRILRAAEMIADSERTFSEIAEGLGYPDLFLFSRQFKQVMGESPRAYRHRLSVRGGATPVTNAAAFRTQEAGIRQLDLFES